MTDIYLHILLRAWPTKWTGVDLSRDSVEVDAIMHPELDAEGEPVPELLTIQQLTTDPCLGGPVSQPHMTPY